MKSEKKLMITVTAVFMLLIAAVSFSGCLDSADPSANGTNNASGFSADITDDHNHDDHNHTADDGHDHAEGDTHDHAEGETHDHAEGDDHAGHDHAAGDDHSGHDHGSGGHDHDHDDGGSGDHDHDHDHDTEVTYTPLTAEQIAQIESEEKILVAATNLPQTEFIEKVGGENVIAIAMIPPGAGHHFAPSEEQLADLAHASLYMELDANEVFETTNMEAFRAANPNMDVHSSSEGVTLLGTDSHIWTSPLIAILMVENTYAALAEIDPDNAVDYRANADAYIAELGDLDTQLTDDLSGLSSSHFMVYHPALGYFADAYDLTQYRISFAGEEPTESELATFVNYGTENGVFLILVESESDVESATLIADAIAAALSEEAGEEINCYVHVINPLAKNYIENIGSIGHLFAHPSHGGGHVHGEEEHVH